MLVLYADCSIWYSSHAKVHIHYRIVYNNSYDPFIWSKRIYISLRSCMQVLSNYYDTSNQAGLMQVCEIVDQLQAGI